MNSNEIVTADDIVINEHSIADEIVTEDEQRYRQRIWSMIMGHRSGETRQDSPKKSRKSDTYYKVYELDRKYFKKWEEARDNVINNIHSQFHRYLDLERDSKRSEEYYEIHGEYPPTNYAMLHGKKRRRLENKYEVELANLRLLFHESEKQRDKIRKKSDNIGITFIHEYSKLQKIKNKNKKKLERETCSICCDNHKINKMITTSCGHHFGTYCFAQYIDVNFDKLNDIVCPLCRNDNLESFTKYH
jgi:hypothetical protein